MDDNKMKHRSFRFTDSEVRILKALSQDCGMNLT